MAKSAMTAILWNKSFASGTRVSTSTIELFGCAQERGLRFCFHSAACIGSNRPSCRHISREPGTHAAVELTAFADIPRLSAMLLQSCAAKSSSEWLPSLVVSAITAGFDTQYPRPGALIWCSTP